MNRKLIITLIAILLTGIAFSQAPYLINYQAVARDGSGNIITSGTIGLKFRILQGSATGTVAYAETNTASPSTSGIFTAGIGGGTPLTGPLSSVNWATGPYFIEVSIDPTGGTSYNVVGTSQLLSVPYALYAEKSGTSSGALPTGTVTGQTMYWDNSTSQWVVNSNLFNNGNNVNVGEPLFSNNKMKVVSKTSSDSAALFVYKPNSTANQAAIRGFATGNATNSGSLAINPIVGGHFLGYNVNSNGSSVGALGQGVSPSGDAVGLIGIASSSAASVGRSVGVYGTATGPNYSNAYAAVFDRGKVYINDTIISGANGNVGDVLTRGAGGKTYWASASSTGPWTQAVGSVTLTNANDNVVIGPTVGGGKLSIGTNSLFASNDLSISSYGASEAIQVFKFSGGSALRLVNASSTSSAIATIAMISGNNPIGLDINISSNSNALQAKNNGSMAAVSATNTGNAPSIRGTKDALSSGAAGMFDQNNTSSNSDALVGLSTGTGAGVRAMTGTLTASALSLLVDGGHIRAIGPAAGIGTVGVAGGFSAIASPTCISCNDVRGVVSFSTGVTGFLTTNNADVTINFAKPYGFIPNVTLTPLTDMQDLSYVVVNTTTTSFTIRVYRSSNRSVPVSVPNSLFKFNYLVIE